MPAIQTMNQSAASNKHYTRLLASLRHAIYLLLLRRADAAQVCSDGGFVVAHDHSERGVAAAARQSYLVCSAKYGERGGLKHKSLAATSAFHSTRRRETSSWPLKADE
jgi:hypothetical protein